MLSITWDLGTRPLESACDVFASHDRFHQALHYPSFVAAILAKPLTCPNLQSQLQSSTLPSFSIMKLTTSRRRFVATTTATGLLSMVPRHLSLNQPETPMRFSEPRLWRSVTDARLWHRPAQSRHVLPPPSPAHAAHSPRAFSRTRALLGRGSLSLGSFGREYKILN